MNSDGVYVPGAAIGCHVFPYLDRHHWNRLSVANQELHAEASLRTPPWPDHDHTTAVSTTPNRSTRSDDNSGGDNSSGGRAAASVALHVDMVFSMEFSKGDGQYLACGTFDGQIMVFHSQTGRFTSLQEPDGDGTMDDVRRVVFPSETSPHTLISVANDGKVRIWDDIRETSAQPARSRLLGQIDVTPRIDPNDKVCLSPDGSILALGCDLNRRRRHPSKIEVWDVPGQKCIQRFVFPVTIPSITAMELCSDCGAAYLAVALFGNRVCLWDLDKIVPKNKIKKGTTKANVRNAISQPTVGGAGTTSNSNIPDAPAIPPTLVLKRHKDIVQSVAWSPPLLPQPDQPIQRQRYLACGLLNSTIYIWGVPDRTCLHVLGNPSLTPGSPQASYALSFSPDNNGELLVSGCQDGSLSFWNVNEGMCLSKTQPQGVHQDRIWGLAFTPDGRTVATYSTDGTIRFQKASAISLLAGYGKENKDGQELPQKGEQNVDQVTTASNQLRNSAIKASQYVGRM